MDRGAWWATVHGAAEWDTTEFSLQQSGQPDQWTSKRHRVSPAPRGTAVWTARPMDWQASPCELRFPRNRSAAPSLGPHPSPAASRTPCCLPWKNAAAFWPGPPSSPFLRLQPDMCQIGTHLALLKTEPKCETKLSSGLRPPLRPPLSPRAPGYSPQTRRAPSTDGAGSSQPCPAAGYPRRAEPHPHRHPPASSITSLPGLSGDLVHTGLPAWRAGMPEASSSRAHRVASGQMGQGSAVCTGLCRCRRAPSVGWAEG